MATRPKATAIVAVTLASAAAGIIMFLTLRWVFTTWNAWQFSLRPEVENWAIPALGTEMSALAWALTVTVVSFAAACLFLAHWRARLSERR